MKKTIQAIVVDDHHLFRSGIVALLSGSPTIQVVGEASDGYGAIDLLKEKKVDIAILDLEMPGMNGMETCKKIQLINSDIAILILSWHCNETQLSSLLELGAKGFLAKDCTKEELRTAIDVMAQGGSYFSQPLGEIILKLKGKRNDTSLSKERQILTEREQEVLECIANEYTNKEIAGQLFISQRTVETHRRNLIQKLKVKNTVGLVKYYFQKLQLPKHALRINT